MNLFLYLLVKLNSVFLELESRAWIKWNIYKTRFTIHDLMSKMTVSVKFIALRSINKNKVMMFDHHLNDTN